MKNIFPRLLGSIALLLPLTMAYAQAPIPYLVTSTCPGSANIPSVLRRVPPVGLPIVAGTVNVGGTGIVVNGIGANTTDPFNIYAMSSATGGGLQQPQFYRINLANAAATSLGLVGPPPVPAATFPDIGQSFVINQAADGGPTSNYYLTGASLIYNLFTNTVSNVRLHLGEISLAPAPNPTAPTWRLINTSDPGATAIINNLTVQANAYLAGTGPLPDGGFQDLAYIAASGNIVTYLGIEQRFVVVSNINTTPILTVTTPTVLLPTGGGSPLQIGALYRTAAGDLFALRSSTGRAYTISPTTGDYLGGTFITQIGCALVDGGTAPGAVTLPLTLTGFSATAAAGGVQLTWQTAAEKDVSRFVVERSAQGRTWADGPTVAATNQPAGARYGVLDPGEPGATRYYRLRMEDRDGSRTWSDVRAVTLGDADPITLLPTWPNPARATVAVGLSAPVAGEAQLVNQLGRVVWRGPLTAGRAEADVRALAPGVYELIARFGDGQTAHQRVAVARE